MSEAPKGELVAFPGSRVPEQRPAEMTIIEPVAVIDTFVTDLARLDIHGPFARLTWCVPSKAHECHEPTLQNLVASKLLMPTENLRTIYDAIGRHLPPAD